MSAKPTPGTDAWVAAKQRKAGIKKPWDVMQSAKPIRKKPKLKNKSRRK